MKMTIVLDTDDTKGLDDAYKIALIKFIRTFARECEAQVASTKITGEDPELSTLRNTKRFVDAHWDRLQEA